MSCISKLFRGPQIRCRGTTMKRFMSITSNTPYTIELINDNKTILTTLDSNAANFLNSKALDDLNGALDKIENDLTMKYKPIIFTSPEDSKCFSAGMDLKAASEMKEISESKEFFGRFEDTLARIATLQHRTIAKIHGHAVAAGFFLGLACDVRCGLDDDKIMISLPEMEIGIPFPSLCYRLILTRMPDAANELFISKPAKPLTPRQAFEKRYLTDLAVYKDELMDLCLSEADRVLPDSMKAYLSVKNYLWRTTVEDVWNQEKKECLQEFAEYRHSEESQRLVLQRLEQMKSKKVK